MNVEPMELANPDGRPGSRKAGPGPGRRPAPAALPMAALAAALVAALLGGCVADRSPEPVAPVAAPEPVPLPQRGRPDSRPAPGPGPALVLSRDLPYYRAVSAVLEEQLSGAGATYVLSGESPDAVLETIRSQGHEQAIAIGRDALALLAASELAVVWCQVFEPGDLAAGHAGIPALPAYTAQLDAWRRLDPDLQSVGVIMGPGRERAAADLGQAATERNVRLHHAVARSDKELLYVFRRMVPELDGFLLYPDARILSPGALRELLAYAAKHQVTVVTYNRAVFELGADVLMEADPREVARRALDVLDTAPPGGPAGNSAGLERVRIELRTPEGTVVSR